MQRNGRKNLKNNYEGSKLLAPVSYFCLVAFLVAASTWPTAGLNISDLENRVAMLLDVRAKVLLMKRGLSDIVRVLTEDKSSLR
jgi:hypothetical protein